MDEEERKARLTARFAGARKRLLSIRHPAEYARLEKTGELESHLMTIGEEAADHYLTLEAQLKARAAAIRRSGAPISARSRTWPRRW